ncbi:hypothetical protein JY651_17225 [Pyxidicoccus parkwayensis]|uniref:DUF6531 domain-containing protein n=1 Tax=Pyxidicoccus parkwayensis TaxID=2813578 RepID=A0ABX7P7Y6_9BACT|nr:RHS repeat-associated core domain-containing protein [Pyxidicoccus parkwaysis]QSQ26563.1 hypothetical protein JY651_17225 [Pyxidicoccus parkwaysis]
MIRQVAWLGVLLGLVWGCGGEPKKSEPSASPSLARAAQSVSGDVTPPVITFSGVAQGAYEKTVPNVSWTVTDQSPTTVEAWLDGVPISTGGNVTTYGGHALVVRATDSMGLTTTATRTFVFDSIAPTVQIHGIEDGKHTNAAAVFLSWTVNDEYLLGTMPLLNGDIFRISEPPTSEGRYELAVTARDRAENATTSTVLFFIDRTPPEFTFMSVADGDVIKNVPVDLDFKADATVPGGGVTPASVVAKLNGADVTLPMSLNTDGDYSLVLTATDPAGNSLNRTIHFVIDATPDAGSADAGTSDAGSADAGSSDAGGGTDAGGGSSDAGSSDAGGGTDAGGGSSDAGPSQVDGGTDAGTGRDAGSEGGPDPVLVVEAPDEGGVYGGTQLVVRGRIEGGTPPMRVTVQGVSMAVNGTEFSGALPLPDGDHTLQFRVTDARGRTDAETRSVAMDSHPPELTLQYPSEVDSVVSEAPYLLRGVVGDPHLVEVLVDGTRVRVIAGAFSALVPLQANARKEVTVTAVDVAGNRTVKKVWLTLRSSAPEVTILDPLPGTESPSNKVTVRARVRSSAPLREVLIGTGVVHSDTDTYVAEVPLEFGDNVIRVTAEDTQIPDGGTQGMMGSASVTVHYRDASQEPLAVTGVAPRAGEQGVEPDSLVSVAFNKPIKTDGVTLADHFKVRANGEVLKGSFSVAPGEQTLSFIARDPLPEGARLMVEVSGLEAKTPPGMSGTFSSDFTVRRPLTRVRGYVVDADYRPLSGVKVTMEEQGLTTITGPDGNWTLFAPHGGERVLRYEGGLTSDGRSFPTVRRRLVVTEEGDTLDAPLALTPVDLASSQAVDSLGDTALRFAGRQPELEVNVPAGGLFFEDGTTRGLVTATEVAPYALPLPVEGRAAPGALWQIGPAGMRLEKAVSSLSLPNRSNLPAHRLVMVLGHDPRRHVLKRVGFAQVSDDGKRLQPLGTLGLTSLEFLGYVPLDEEQHKAIAAALGLSPDAGTSETPEGSGAGMMGLRQRVRPVNASEPLWKQFVSNFVLSEAHAQLGSNLDLAAFNAFDTMMNLAVPGAVMGSVRAPLERQLVMELRAPAVPAVGEPATEKAVTLPYRLELDFRSRFESADPYDVENPETVQVTLTAKGPDGDLSEPDGETGTWQARGEGEAALKPKVDLPPGKTELTLTALSKSTHRVLKLEAELTQDAGGGPQATLKLRTTQNTFNEADDEAVHSPIRFQNLRVTLTGPGSGSAGATGPTGGYGIPVAGLMGGEMGISCTEVPTGPRLVERVGEDGVVHYTPTINQFPVCSESFWLYPGRTTRADILVDVRMLYGNLTFVDRQGEPLEMECSSTAHSAKSERPGEFDTIAVRDVTATEVHFFREDDLEHPIATFAQGKPNEPLCMQGGGTGPHGTYARVRTGPAARIRQMARARCRELEGKLGTPESGGLSPEEQGYYDGNCRDNRTNYLRLNPGERLVVFAVNHATGYAGMNTVTVPTINRIARDSTGACQLDTAAGGPLEVMEFGEKMTLSRCTQAELGIPADVKLFPPELDVRVARRITPEGVQAPAKPSLIRHGGSATTKDDFLQVTTHWRVRQLKEPADAGVPDAGSDGGVDGGANGGGDGGIDERAWCQDAGTLSDGGICEPGMIRDLGTPGEELEVFCSELPPTSPQRLLGRCDQGTPRVVDVPPGVPPLAGRVLQVTGTSIEQPTVMSFPVRPGRHTASVQASLVYQNASGERVAFSSLPRANYYLHVVGHPMYERDRNDDGFLQAEEQNAPPPDFCVPGECKDKDGNVEPNDEPGGGLKGMPQWALGLKNVYRHRESDGTALERYDRAREHEFRVLAMGDTTITAHSGVNGAGLDGGAVLDAGTVLAGPDATATDDDVAYTFLMNDLQEPKAPGRAGTLDGEYRLRLGTDDFGIECPVEFNSTTRQLSGTCDGEYLAEVLSAADVLYFELYLSGNADNVLYRFNFHGISPRTDFVTAGSVDTVEKSLAQPGAAPPSLKRAGLTLAPVTERPISVKAMAHFAIEPEQLTTGVIRVCEGPVCDDKTLLKAARLRYVAGSDASKGRYEVVEYVDQQHARVTKPFIQYDTSGVNGARRFALPLSNDVGRMEDLDSRGRELFLVIQPDATSGPGEKLTFKLGEPVGRYTFVNARAAGQTVVQGVNLAGGHLRMTHEDFSIPHLGEVLQFARTFNNQNNVVTALGTGWSHNYDGFVLEEELGRYTVVLSGQSYDFPSCDTVNPELRTASDCHSDKSHGGTLVVYPEGPEFTTENGHVYRFYEKSVQSGPEDQRRWVLTELSNGTGTDSPKQGWTTLTYEEDSDRVARVTRSPGLVTLVFEYQDFADTASAKLRLLARSENLKRLSAVGVYLSSDVPVHPLRPSASKAIHRVEFEHDSTGNLLRAVRRTGSPHQAWKYEYARLPDDATGYARWRLVNELRSARLQLTSDETPPATGDLPYFDQWVATYSSSGSSKTYEHVQQREVIDGALISGEGPGSFVYTYLSGGERKVKRPDGVNMAFTLTDYGSVTSMKVGDLPEQTTHWRDDGQVSPDQVTLPNQAQLKYDIDPSHRLKSVQLAEKPADSVETPGVHSGTFLTQLSYLGANSQRFGIADQKVTPSQSGTQSVSTRVTSEGRIQGFTVTNSDGTTATDTGNVSYALDGSGVVASAVDALNQQITYAEPNALGLPQRITVTNAQASSKGGLATLTRLVTYDRFGRVESLTEAETGAEENWRYDSVGRVTFHSVKGEPAQVWTYTYTPGDRRLKVEERLNGSVDPVKTVETWEVTAGDDASKGLFVRELTPFGPPEQLRTAVRLSHLHNGRLESTTDAVGVKRVYEYDTSNRLTGVRITEAGTTEGPVGGYEARYLDFEPNGSPRQVVDHNGLLTSMGYDFLGRPVFWDYTGAEVISGERSSEEVQRNLQGDVLYRAFGNNASNHVLDLDPDALGHTRRVRSNLSGGASVASVNTTFEYDVLGRVTRKQDHVMGTDEHYEYFDVLGRLTLYTRKVESGSGQLELREERAYDDAAFAATGRRKMTLTRTIGTGGSATRTEHIEQYEDAAGRLLEEVRLVEGERASWQYTYDARGMVKTVVEPTEGTATETTTFHYDSAGNLYRKDEAGDAENPAPITQYFVDGEGRVIRQTGPHAAEEWQYTYDVYGQLKTKQLVATTGNPVGAKWTYAYKLADKPGADGTVPNSAVEETDPLGYKTYRYYNARKQLLKEVREDKLPVSGGGTSTQNSSQVTTYAYAGDWLQKVTSTEETLGKPGGPSVLTVERTKFDDRGRVLGERETWQRGTDSYEYITETPWTGRTVTMTQRGTVSASPPVTLPAREATLVVNSLGQLVSRTQGGLTDAWSYDAAGTLLKESPAGQPPTAYTYVEGLLTEVAFGSGSSPERTELKYRRDGRLKSVKKPSERMLERFYGPRGLLVKERFGRDGETTETRYAYDSGGNVTKVWKDTSNPTDLWEYKHGPLGELTKVTPPGMQGFEYVYDAARNLKNINRPAGGMPSESFDYDYLGRAARHVRGSSVWVTSWVNGMEQVTSPDNSEGLSGGDTDKVETLLDGRGRSVWVVFSPGASSVAGKDLTRVSYAYDFVDGLVQANEERDSGNVLNTFEYDARNRLTHVLRGKDHSTDTVDDLEYSYVSGSDLLHKRTSGLAVNGPRLEEEFGYDALARINHVLTRSGDDLVTSRAVSWEPGGGALATVTDDDDSLVVDTLVERRCHDGRGWLKAIRTAKTDDDVACNQTPTSLVVGFNYTYDNRGNRLGSEELRPGSPGALVRELTEYGYDKADRLTGVRYPGAAAVLYKLAPDGTRLGERHVASHSGALTESAYDAATGAQKKLVYGFDSAGGLKSLDDLALAAGSQRQLDYFTDGSGRRRSEGRPGNPRTDYVWDAAGRLVEVKLSTPDGEGGTTSTSKAKYRYGFDGLRRSKTVGANTSRYVWGGEELVEEQLGGGATRLQYEQLAGVTVGAGGQRVLHDGLGSAVGRIAANGTPELNRFDAWGGYRDGSGPNGTKPSVGYTGHAWDSDAGLTYAQQRWYDSATGNFLSKDPMGARAYIAEPNGLNPWLYANGNPLSFSDPTGRRAQTDYEQAQFSHMEDYAAARRAQYDSRPEWQQIMYRILGSSEKRDSDVLRANIRSMSAAIERAKDGEKVFAGSSEERRFYDPDGHVLFTLPINPAYITASEARRSKDLANGEALAFTPFATLGYGIASAAGGDQNDIDAAIQLGGTLGEVMLAFENPVAAETAVKFVKNRFNPANYFRRPKKPNPTNDVLLPGLIFGVPFEDWPWEYRPPVEPKNVILRPTDAIFDTHTIAYERAMKRAGLTPENSIFIDTYRFGPDSRIKAQMGDNYVLFRERPVPKNMVYLDAAWKELYDKRSKYGFISEYLKDTPEGLLQYYIVTHTSDLSQPPHVHAGAAPFVYDSKNPFDIRAKGNRYINVNGDHHFFFKAGGPHVGEGGNDE